MSPTVWTQNHEHLLKTEKILVLLLIVNCLTTALAEIKGKTSTDLDHLSGMNDTSVLQNLTIIPYLDENNYVDEKKLLRLNITWKCPEGYKVEGIRMTRLGRKVAEVHPNDEIESIVIPNLKLERPIDDLRVFLAHKYHLTFTISKKFKKLRTIQLDYTVPECVQGQCTCYLPKYAPKMNITHILPTGNDGFSIYWSLDNRTDPKNNFTKTDFYYKGYTKNSHEKLEFKDITIYSNNFKAVVNLNHTIKKFISYEVTGKFYNQYDCGVNITKYADMDVLLYNYTIEPYYDRHIIRLNISWNSRPDFNVTRIDIIPQDQTFHITKSPMGSNIIIPDPRLKNPYTEIALATKYDLTFLGSLLDNRKIELKQIITYMVPECLEGKCTCYSRKYVAKVQISSIIYSAENNSFNLHWITNRSNPSNKIIHADFDYRMNNSEGRFKFKEIYLDIENESAVLVLNNTYSRSHAYKIRAYFHNIYGCSIPAYGTLSEMKKTTKDMYIIYIIPTFAVLAILLLICEFKTIKKIITKILDKFHENSTNDMTLARLIPTNQVINPAYATQDAKQNFELARGRITITEELGKGAFGQVYLAKAYKIEEQKEYTMVAVKTLRDNATDDEQRNFLDEIELMKKIGHHENIVKLLGCCTVDQPFWMIMELIPCGDLLHYLIDLRKSWENMNNRNRNSGSDGAYIFPKARRSSESITSSRLPSYTETVITSIPESESEPSTPILAEYASALDKVLDPKVLQEFALQIAKGMAYLEAIPITHRDLAARNILINERKELKISDFGMSKQGPYVVNRKTKVPLRWLALESISDKIYNSKTDVWSFGIVLWEIGTLGAFPYEDIEDNLIYPSLLKGTRLYRPEICTDQLYSLMKQCWLQDSSCRPTFSELVDLLDVKRTKIYADLCQLNPTYVFPPIKLEGKIR